MKTISHYNSKKLLHIETPLGIINIRVGLTDRLGRSVDSIEVIPSNYAGQNKVKRSGLSNTRLIKLKKGA
tara:strand:- start:1124 stop:1333 length:210 start_codon:yes stop_codon:yes gene_type:complete